MASKKIIGFIMLVMTFLGCCSAKRYKVGDSDGWTYKEDMYHSWSKGKEFHVGDSLVFNYDRNINDVAQVSGDLEYKLCDSSSPKAVHNTGEDVVTLTEPGHHYFITSNHLQCTYGQKLDVLVVQDKSHPTPPPPPSKARPIPPPPASKSHPIPPPPPSKSHPTPPPPPSKARPVPPPPPSKARPTPPPPPSKARPVSPPPPSKARPVSPPPPSKARPTPPPPPSKSRPTPPPPPSKSPSTSPPPPPPSKILPLGKIYKVGDIKGWSVYNSYFYYRWSEAKQFYVGDNLFFQYNKDLNNVIEISDELEFKACEPNSTVAVYETGHDLVKLTKPGVYYFISLKTGLCQAGLKLRVTVRPLPEAVTSPNVPPKRLSPIERLNRWLRSLRPPHHP